VKIRHLKIEHLRNITIAELDFNKSVNVISGDNGAGKSTLLEAIYLLSKSRTFRQGQKKSPIQQGSDHFLIYATSIDQHNQAHRIGFYRSHRETKVKIDGQRTDKLSKLARNIPTALVTPQSHRLIEEGPEQRRRLLNWGVFHVEHHFQTTMANFSRTLLQRNNALRSLNHKLEIWDKAFVESALKVNKFQKKYFNAWKKEILGLCENISFLQSLNINFHPGWRENLDLSELLEERRHSDKERGFTGIGPHRADVEIKIDSIPTKQILSRGQQKVLITVILLAQARLLEANIGEKPIFLFDDLDSELDSKSTQLIAKLLAEQNNQTFITSLNKEKIRSLDWSETPEMFHVEHGRFV
jgi:DNA replication and repair protein RecF